MASDPSGPSSGTAQRVGTARRNTLLRTVLFLSAYQVTVGMYQSWDEGMEPSYLFSLGISMPMIALNQSIAFIPFALRLVFARLSDVFNPLGLGHRRPFCVLGLFISGLCFLLLTLSPPSGRLFPLYITTLVLRNIGIAIADGATDGFSVDAGLEDNSGGVQACMMIGKMGGLIISSAIGGPLAAVSYPACLTFLGLSTLAFIPINCLVQEEDAGWDESTPPPPREGLPPPPALPEVEAKVVVPAPPPPTSPPALHAPAHRPHSETDEEQAGLVDNTSVITGEDDNDMDELTGKVAGVPTPTSGDTTAAPPPQPAPPARTPWQVLLAQLREPAVIGLVVFTFVTQLGAFLASFPVVMYLETQANPFDVTEIGWLTVVGGVGYAAFSVLMGLLFDRSRDKRPVLAACGALMGCSYLLFAAADGSGSASLFTVYFIVAGGMGALFTVTCSMVRLLAHPIAGASLFGVVLGCLNLGAVLGTMCAGGVAEALGDAACFWIGGLITLAGLSAVPWIVAPHAPPRELEAIGGIELTAVHTLEESQRAVPS